MLIKIIIQIVLIIIGVLIDAYQVERYLENLKRHKKTFILKPKYLLWGFIQKTHLSSISGLALLPSFLWIVNSFPQTPSYFIPIAIIAVIVMRFIGNSIQYLLFRFLNK